MSEWLTFTPVSQTRNHTTRTVVGAHAFNVGAPRSACGYVEASKAGDPAPPAARKCTWCERVLAGTAPDRSDACSSSP
jgi:hypothetical protein